MILSSASVCVPFRPSVNGRPMCLASNVNTEQLRSQLDQLHLEAENTRAKANQQRLRLLRLSERVENLKQQAAVSVQTGRENEARELLLQKKKVLKALEKSKSRIELLDRLSTKLNEAISVKESQLIGSVAVDLEVDTEAATTQVRIVSPKRVVREETMENTSFGSESSDAQNLPRDQGLQASEESQSSPTIDMNPKNIEGAPGTTFAHGYGNGSSLKEVCSYEDYLEHLDQQLCKIETELITILNASSLVLDSVEKPKNFKFQQIMDILESIHCIRERIANIVQRKVKIK